METQTSRSNCWFRRSPLEKILIVSLTLSIGIIFTMAIVVISYSVRQHQILVKDRLVATAHVRGQSSPLTGVEGSSSAEDLDIKYNEPHNIGQTSGQGPVYSTTTESSEERTKPKKVKEMWSRGEKNSARFTSSEEVENSKHLEPLRKKIKMAERAFVERYPRDGAGVALRQLGQFLPRPLAKVGVADSRNQSDGEKISEIISSLDLDGNGSGGAWELHDWMLWVEKRVHQHVVEDQWASLGLMNNLSIGWSEYNHKVHPFGLRDAKARRRFAREKRRWQHADKDDDDRLTKSEFKKFLFPHLNDDATEIVVHEAHEALDADYDGRVSQSEFVAVHRNSPDESEADNRPEAVYFKSFLDGDGSGYLDVEEIAKWVEPTGFVQAKSEVVYLMQHLDLNGDKEISVAEATSKPNIFLKSQVTFFGQLYDLKNLRDEVFLVNSR